MGKWHDKAFMYSNQGSYLVAIKHFKSSLKRDIEKRIDKLEDLKRKRPQSIDPNRIDELEYILELIETVEP